MKARLHPKWTKGGYRWAVMFGNRVIENSRDPEFDAARALVAMGASGRLTICDGKTGIPRTVIPDIEKAAGLTVTEGPNAPRLRKYRAERCGERPHSRETVSPGGEIPEAAA